MRITHCLLCTLGTTQALTMSSYLTPLTNSQTAPLMFEPIHGDETYCASDPFNQTLVDDKAIDCREHAMVLFINRRTRCILLEVPNAVGWKLHFGLALSKNEDVDARVAEAVAASGVFCASRRSAAVRPARSSRRSRTAFAASARATASWARRRRM